MPKQKIPIFTVTSHIKAIRLAHKIMRENNYKYVIGIDTTSKGDKVTIYIWKDDVVVDAWHIISIQECISTLNKILEEGIKENE